MKGIMKSAIVALFAANSVMASNLRTDAPAAEPCPKKDGEKQGRVLDCKEVVIPTDALTGGTAKKTAFCNQFWTFNCDGDGDERCQTLNPRVCAPSGKRLDRCALLKSKGGDNYKKCRPTEVQAADLVRDFEADDSFDNWFSGECSSGNGVEVKFKVPSGEDKTLDGCAEAEKSKE